eukprot:Skav216133  [mRNA]  locus=scaffold1946:336257:336830:- [translate_table: standard]
MPQCGNLKAHEWTAATQHENPMSRYVKLLELSLLGFYFEFAWQRYKQFGHHDFKQLVLLCWNPSARSGPPSHPDPSAALHADPGRCSDSSQ